MRKHLVTTGVLGQLMFLVSQVANAGSGEVLLGGLKVGQKFEIIENLSVTVPPLLRMLGEIPPLQATENAIRISGMQGTTEPVCLVSGLGLGPAIPDQLNLPKGTMIEVKSVAVEKKPHPKFSGSAVAFAVQAQGTQVKAKFRCYAGKGVKGTMAVEVFERLFRRKVRLLSSG
jgi:hypothetical protein